MVVGTAGDLEPSVCEQRWAKMRCSIEEVTDHVGDAGKGAGIFKVSIDSVSRSASVSNVSGIAQAGLACRRI